VETITCSYFFCILVNNKYKLDIILINCSIVASFISVFLLFQPNIAFYLKTNLLKYPEHLIENFFFRGFGFTDGFFFAYPVVLGFCAGFIIMGVCNKKKYLFCLLPLSIAIIFNARSGIVPVFTGFCLSMIYNFKFAINTIILCVIVVLLFLSKSLDFYTKNNIVMGFSDWFMNVFYDLENIFVKKEMTGVVQTLLSDMLIFPQNTFEWIVGSGICKYTEGYERTDIGYLLRLNYGGIIYSSLYFILLVFMFLRLVKVNKHAAYLLFISLIYLNFKGDFFIINPSSRFFFFVYVICLMNHSYFKPIKITQKIN
jgi:hypothetical protein